MPADRPRAHNLGGAEHIRTRYGLDARGLRPVHEWTGGFERFWNESFDRLDAYVQELKQARQEE